MKIILSVSRRLAAVVVVLVCGGAVGPGPTPPAGDPLGEHAESISRRIEQLKDSKSIDPAKPILLDILALQVPSKAAEPKSFRLARDEKLRLLLRLNQALNRQIDPDFDPKRDHMALDSSRQIRAQPGQVNKAEREKRQEQAQTREEKRQWWNRQMLLRRHLQPLSESMFALMKAGYDPAEKSVLLELLKQEVPDKEARAKLDEQYLQFDREYDAVLPGVAYKKAPTSKP